MGTTTAYQCDGPKCTELTTRESGARFPDGWPRLTLQMGDARNSGSFHDIDCAHAWVDQQLGITRAGDER